MLEIIMNTIDSFAQFLVWANGAATFILLVLAGILTGAWIILRTIILARDFWKAKTEEKKKKEQRKRTTLVAAAAKKK